MGWWFSLRDSFNLVSLEEGGKEVEGKVTVRIGLVLLLDYAITVEGELRNQQTSPRLINGATSRVWIIKTPLNREGPFIKRRANSFLHERANPARFQFPVSSLYSFYPSLVSGYICEGVVCSYRSRIINRDDCQKSKMARSIRTMNREDGLISWRGTAGRKGSEARREGGRKGGRQVETKGRKADVRRG